MTLNVAEQGGVVAMTFTTNMRSILKLLRRRRKTVAAVLLCPVLVVGGTLAAADLLCKTTAKGHVYDSVSEVPENEVAVVLGTSRYTAQRRPNLHFERRITTAAKLYHSGKVKHLLVSGDNHRRDYDEPTDMLNALVAAGVPAEAITRDYAGFRTLDSIIRARNVFGLQRFTIVTEEFHCDRAVWIARAHGLNAVAMAAPDIESIRWSARVKAREVLARVMCAADLYVLKTRPRFSGPPEPIHIAAVTAPEPATGMPRTTPAD